MKTIIRPNRALDYLELRHLTDDGYTGILIMPFTSLPGSTSSEQVYDPMGILIHEAEFPTRNLGDDVDLEPYLIGITLTAARGVAA